MAQCALIARRYSPCLNRYYENTKARRGTRAAIIALARKLIRITNRTLKNTWVFEDFHNVALAEEACSGGGLFSGCGAPTTRAARCAGRRSGSPPPLPSVPCSRTVLDDQGPLRLARPKLCVGAPARPRPLRAVSKNCP